MDGHVFTSGAAALAVVALVVGLVDLVINGVLWLGMVLMVDAVIVVGVEAPLKD